MVFITAYQEYAIQAVKVRAFDYLLKPIDKDELSQTIKRFIQRSIHSEVSIKGKDRLIVKTTHFVHFIPLENILYFKADGAYTQIVCADQSIHSSRNLKFYEDYLNGNERFYRCHKSYIVQRNKILSINKVRQEVILNNGDAILVALERMESLIQA